MRDGVTELDDDVPALTAPRTIPEAAIPEVLRNIARDLQVRPTRYRWFGVWWWPIKAMLRRCGMGPLLGPMLGATVDRDAVATLPAGMGAGEMLAEGLAHYGRAARLAPLAEWADAPNGDRVRIHDPDIES